MHTNPHPRDECIGGWLPRPLPTTLHRGMASLLPGMSPPATCLLGHAGPKSSPPLRPLSYRLCTQHLQCSWSDPECWGRGTGADTLGCARDVVNRPTLLWALGGRHLLQHLAWGRVRGLPAEPPLAWWPKPSPCPLTQNLLSSGTGKTWSTMAGILGIHPARLLTQWAPSQEMGEQRPMVSAQCSAFKDLPYNPS